MAGMSQAGKLNPGENFRSCCHPKLLEGWKANVSWGFYRPPVM